MLATQCLDHSTSVSNVHSAHSLFMFIGFGEEEEEGNYILVVLNTLHQKETISVPRTLNDANNKDRQYINTICLPSTYVHTHLIFISVRGTNQGPFVLFVVSVMIKDPPPPSRTWLKLEFGCLSGQEHCKHLA